MFSDDSIRQHEQVKKGVAEESKEDKEDQGSGVRIFSPTFLLDLPPNSLCSKFSFFKGTEEKIPHQLSRMRIVAPIL